MIDVVPRETGLAAFFTSHIDEPLTVKVVNLRPQDKASMGKHFSAIPFETGEIYAENGEEELRADEAFYPVLMSSDGYDEILGFKGRRPEEGLKGKEVNR